MDVASAPRLIQDWTALSQSPSCMAAVADVEMAAHLDLMESGSNKDGGGSSGREATFDGRRRTPRPALWIRPCRFRDGSRLLEAVLRARDGAGAPAFAPA